MLHIAAALAVCAFSVAACSGGDESATGGSAGPAVSSSSSASGGATSGVLELVAVYRPVCGPEPRPTAGASAPACPEEPVGAVEVVATGADGTVVARGTTAADGRVSLALAPGTYTLTAAPAPPPRITPRPTSVTVGTEPMPTVTLVYESSMQ